MQLTLSLVMAGGGVFAQLPAQGDIVAKFQNAVSSDNTQWIDTNASGAYEVEEGHSWLADGTTYGVLAVPIVLQDFVITITCKATDLGLNRALMCGDNVFEGITRIGSNGNPQTIINNSSRIFTSITILVNEIYTHEIVRSGVNQTWTATHQDGTIQTESLTGATADYLFKSIGVWGAADEFLGNMRNARVEDSTGIVFSNFLAQDSTDMKMLSEIGPDVQFVNGTYPIIEKSVEHGHEWENYSVVADNSKIPQDPVNPGLDVLGNPLTNPGTPQKNLKVTGYTGDWDGTAYALPATPIVLPTDFTIQFSILYNDTGVDIAILGDESVSGDSSLLWINSDGNNQIYFKIGANTQTFTSNFLVDGTYYDVKISRSGTTLTLILNDGTPEAEPCLTTVVSFKYIGKYTSLGSKILTSSLPAIQIYNDQDTLSHHWVCESAPTSLQDTIYDIVGGNHAILTDATLPFFTTEMEGSKLFADGFDNVGGSDGLVPYGANTGPLTNQPTEFIDDYCLFDAPLSVSFYDAAVVAGIDTNLYLAGAAIGLTADAWILLASNPLFFGATKNILVMYNDTQSGDTLDQINDYLGI